MLGVAQDYYKSGLHVLPIWHGKKNTTVKTWDPSKRFKDSEIDGLFNGNVSIAIVCGYASGGIEVIDFDNHFGDIDGIFAEFGGIEGVSEVLNKCVIERTGRGGYHLIYKCKKIGNSKKIASRLCSDTTLYPDGYELKNGSKFALIETKGEGGYIVASPSIGYTMIQGSFTEIQTITSGERNILLAAAMSLNEFHTEYSQPVSTQGNFTGDRPGDIFNNSNESASIALELLLAHGWKRAHNQKNLVRPGKQMKDGISATFGYVAPGILNVFSGNAHPFENGGREGESRGYTPYQIMAHLSYNGDFSECSKRLRESGYYDKTQITNKQKKQIEAEVKKNLKNGRYLSPGEINILAEKIDAPVDKVVPLVKKSVKIQEDLKDYEDWPPVKKAEHFLQENYRFRMDIVRRIAEMRTVEGVKWEPLNEHTIYRHIQHDSPKLKFSLDGLKSLLKSDFVERYNPFVDYFENLPKWDGADHIKKLCSYFGVDDSEYFESMVKKAMVRNIKCALEPDYYNRIVVVFSSEKEEIGKSRFFMWLNPFGARYYSDEVLRDNKDSRLALAENFMYNLEELDGLSKYGSAKLKATISTRGVTDRLPYAANKEYFPRRCTFWGSTNQTEFLMNDKNTRWLPFQINTIDWKNYIKEVDPQKMWHQAYELFCSEDFDCELDQQEKDTRNKRNESYRVEDIEESVLRKHLRADETSFMTNAEILSLIQLKADGLKVAWNTVTLGKTLARLGFAKKRENNQRGWGIREVNYNDDEVVEDLPF